MSELVSSCCCVDTVCDVMTGISYTIFLDVMFMGTIICNIDAANSYLPSNWKNTYISSLSYFVLHIVWHKHKTRSRKSIMNIAGINIIMSFPYLFNLIIIFCWDVRLEAYIYLGIYNIEYRIKKQKFIIQIIFRRKIYSSWYNNNCIR